MLCLYFFNSFAAPRILGLHFRLSDNTCFSTIANTVQFFTFVKFYEDIISKVMKIFEFWKKFLKAYGDAFYDVQLPGFFYNNLGLGTNMERDVITFKLSLCKNFSFWLFPLKLLLFLNELSYRFQIGLKWKLFWSSFWECLK